MLDFGDELTVETFKIPWLIWIQIIVLILLIILLYCFSLFPLDPSQENARSASTAFPSSSSASPAPVFLKRNSTLVNHLQPSQREGSETLKGEIVASTSSRRRIVSGEEITELGSTSTKEASNINYTHPCYYFRLAKIAFLKCFGLDCSSDSEDSSSSSKHKKDR